jgi:hypothetical protein
MTNTPLPSVARAARTRAATPSPRGKALASEIVHEYLIGPQDMALIYLSPDPYGRVFSETLDL